MNPQESERWLSDRQAEHNKLQAKRARLLSDLQSAREAYAGTNGSVTEFTRARDRVEHIEHQLEQTQQALETTHLNVTAAREGHERAVRETALAQLDAEFARIVERDGAVIAELVALNRDDPAFNENAKALLAQLQASLDLARGVAKKRGALGVFERPYHVLWALWLALMNATPGMAPRHWDRVGLFESNLVEHWQYVMRLELMPGHQLAQLRQMFGDDAAPQAFGLSVTASCVWPGPSGDPMRIGMGGPLAARSILSITLQEEPARTDVPLLVVGTGGIKRLSI